MRSSHQSAGMQSASRKATISPWLRSRPVCRARLVPLRASLITVSAPYKCAMSQVRSALPLSTTITSKSCRGNVCASNAHRALARYSSSLYAGIITLIFFGYSLVFASCRPRFFFETFAKDSAGRDQLCCASVDKICCILERNSSIDGNWFGSGIRARFFYF